MLFLKTSLPLFCCKNTQTNTPDLVSARASVFSFIITVMLHHIHRFAFINPCVENLPYIHPFAAGAAAALFHRSGSKIIGASRVDCFAQGYCDSDCWGEGGLAYYLPSYSQDKQKIKRASFLQMLRQMLKSNRTHKILLIPHYCWFVCTWLISQMAPIQWIIMSLTYLHT